MRVFALSLLLALLGSSFANFDFNRLKEVLEKAGEGDLQDVQSTGENNAYGQFGAVGGNIQQGGGGQHIGGSKYVGGSQQGRGSQYKGTGSQQRGGDDSQREGGQRLGNVGTGDEQSNFRQQMSGGSWREMSGNQGGQVNRPFRRWLSGQNRGGFGNGGGGTGRSGHWNPMAGQKQGGSEGNFASKNQFGTVQRNPAGLNAPSQNSLPGDTDGQQNAAQSWQPNDYSPQRQGSQPDGTQQIGNQHSSGGQFSAGTYSSNNKQRPKEGFNHNAEQSEQQRMGFDQQSEGNKGFDQPFGQQPDKAMNSDERQQQDYDQRTLNRMRELAKMFLKNRQ